MTNSVRHLIAGTVEDSTRNEMREAVLNDGDKAKGENL